MDHDSVWGNIVVLYMVKPQDLTPERRETNKQPTKQGARVPTLLGGFLVSLPFRCKILRPHTYISINLDVPVNLYPKIQNLYLYVAGVCILHLNTK